MEKAIKEYAKDGWRLHSLVPISSGAAGITELKHILKVGVNKKERANPARPEKVNVRITCRAKKCFVS